jgi:alcohol dehydrogenase YqhD (iron-dependent ADH family)
MKNFTLHNPTRIVFGEGTVSKIGENAKAFGKKVMMVYGRSSIKRSGLYNRVKDLLRSEELEIVEFAGVKSNPLLSHLREGIELAKRQEIDFLLAVGGGSVIDETKGIAAGAMTDGDVWDFFRGKATIRAALPVMTVLTLPASGSEMNGSLVITNDETHQKYGFSSPYLYPMISVLDPTVTYTIPLTYTAYGAVDAISHLIEGYFTHKDPWAPIQDRYVEGLVKTIMESTEKILADPSDYQGRATMMWAATLAWNGLALAGVGKAGLPNHMLEHPLSGIYDIAHGAGLSIVIPGWMKYASGKDSGKFARFAENVLGIKRDSRKVTAEKGITTLKGWFDKIGSPTSFSAAKIPASDLDRIVENAASLAELWGLNDYTKEVISEIYNMCL